MHKKKESFGYRFGMLYRINVSLYRQEIQELGLNPSLVPFTAELYHSGRAMTQHELCKLLAIDKGACTRALKELEKKGFVKRYVNENMKREKFAELTREGSKKAKELLKVLRKSSSVFARGFDDTEKKRILEIMDLMIKNGMEELNERG